MFDFEDIIDMEARGQGACRTILMKNYDIGCNHYLFYSDYESRIGYFNTFKAATIVPFLHTNFIRFIGLSDPEKYLAYKVHDDKFTALHNEGYLYTWCMVSGKVIEEHEVVTEKKWFNKFQVHYPEYAPDRNFENRNGKVLLRSKKETTYK